MISVEEQALQAAPSKARSVWQRLTAWVLSGPIASGVALLLALVFGVSFAAGRDAWGMALVAGMDQPWWTVFTSWLWTSNPVNLGLDILLLLTLGVWLERFLGSRMFVLTAFLTGVVGTALAIPTAYLVPLIDAHWGTVLTQQHMTGIAAGMLGVAAAASFRFGALWRRRLQVSVAIVLLMLLGVSGALEDIAATYAALLGALVGWLAWGRQRDRKHAPGTRREGRVMVALIVAAVTFGALLALRSSDVVGILAPLRYDFGFAALDPGAVAEICRDPELAGRCAHYTYAQRASGMGAKLVALAPLLVQLVLAWGLRAGRRGAMWGTVALQGLLALIAVAHLYIVWRQVHGWQGAAEVLGFSAHGVPSAQFLIPAITPLLLIALVVALRHLFTVSAVPGTYRRFWLVVGGLAVAGWVGTLIVGLPQRGSFVPEAGVGSLTADYLLALLPSSALALLSPILTPTSVHVAWLLGWLPLLPWAGVLVMLLVSYRKTAAQDVIDRAQYRDLVRTNGGGSLAWMTTWPANHFWRSDTYPAGVAYRADGGVALTVSDPVAQPDDRAAVMEEFANFATKNDLIPAFYSAHEPTVAVTDGWGWPRLQVAEETVLPLEKLTFSGKAFQDVRTALNRAKKEGVSPFWTRWGQCPVGYRQQIQAISEEWVAGKGLPEMGFTLGGVDELDDPEVRILLAVDEGDVVQGVTSWMPVYEDEVIVGWTLDFMRRREGGFRPVMEWLIAQAALTMKEEGAQFLSLSGAPLARAKHPQDDDSGTSAGTSAGSTSGALDAILEILGRALEPVYGFRSLLRFKSKFRPEYHPVYLAVPELAVLPAVGLAIGRAYLPTMSPAELAALLRALRGAEREGKTTRNKDTRHKESAKR